MRMSPLTIDGQWFRDRHGRQVTLRGVNLGGDCKVPARPDGHTYRPTDFSDHRDVSFVGRPAPLDEIDDHFARIAHWGFNCLRLLTTWEAVEHSGPGEYDAEYLAYFAEVCRRAEAHGLYVFVDFHQDVWSRMTGGDGAPGWLFEKVGLDFTKFDQADAAFTMQANYDPAAGGRQAAYPQMSWGSNYRMPANGIMWTLFFAGDAFAPEFRIDGRSAQAFLQDHYLGSMRAIAQAVAHCPNVIGFDSLNEPGTGWIAQPMSLSQGLLRGAQWSPLDGLAVASGFSRELPLMEGGTKLANPDGISIWLPGHDCPFRAAEAWDVRDGKPVVLREDHFTRRGEVAVSIEHDFMLPFYHRVAETFREVRADWLLFAELDPFASLRGGHGFPDGMPERTVNASHWYDITALITKSFDPARSVHLLSGTVSEGSAAIEAGYVEELGRLKAAGDALHGGAPSLVGECGIAYDMNDASAYAAWAAGERGEGAWAAQVSALDLMYNALDALQLNSTQWNYTVSNRNDVMVGDGWNQEDLSIWSIDQQANPDDPNSGGRAISGFCRPFARAVQGVPKRQRFALASGVFELTIEADPALSQPTEIYVPDWQYPLGFDIELENGTVEQMAGQTLRVRADGPGNLHIRLIRR